MKTSQKPAQKSKKPKSLSKQTFLEHFQELKNRFTFWLVFFIAASCIGYFFRDRLLAILVSPLQQPLYYSSPAGGFSFVFSLSFFFGFLVSIPVLVYEVLEFVGPVIQSHAKQSAVLTLISSCSLMILGMLFAYFVSLPAALIFLGKFGGEGVRSLISTNEYFSFAARYLTGFGLLFQMPLVIIFLNKIKRLEIRKLLGFERWVIVLSFVAAAILTPTPDIVNQLIMAIPVILLYQASVFLIWILDRRKT